MAETTGTGNRPTVAHPDTDTDTEQTPQRQPPYNVILWNDSDHTFEYVQSMMTRLFGYSTERGRDIANTVHTRGRAIVLTTTLEHAELKRDQIRAFGRDVLVAGCAGSMCASIEVAK